MSICVGGPQLCGGKKGRSSSMHNSALASVQTVTATSTFGGMVGFCTGMFMRRVGRASAVMFGGLVTIFQLAAWSGYVTVNWRKIEVDAMRVLDRNNDGRLDRKDAGLVLEKSVDVLSSNMGPSAAGFTAGFVLGLKR